MPREHVVTRKWPIAVNAQSRQAAPIHSFVCHIALYYLIHHQEGPLQEACSIHLLKVELTRIWLHEIEHHALHDLDQLALREVEVQGDALEYIRNDVV